MAHPVNDHALDVIFRYARSQNGFLGKDVPEILVRAVYDLTKMGPTSANCSPARFVFVHTPAGKQRLLALMSEGNVRKPKPHPGLSLSPTTSPFRKRSLSSSRTRPARRTGSTTTATRLPSGTLRCRVPT